jgi:hypothetical protein
MPRPARRSGWQTTPTILDTAWSAWSAGTANAGVPKKTERIVTAWIHNYTCRRWPLVRVPPDTSTTITSRVILRGPLGQIELAYTPLAG